MLLKLFNNCDHPKKWVLWLKNIIFLAQQSSSDNKNKEKIIFDKYFLQIS